jgi:hypothetical protein
VAIKESVGVGSGGFVGSGREVGLNFISGGKVGINRLACWVCAIAVFTSSLVGIGGGLMQDTKPIRRKRVIKFSNFMIPPLIF